MYLTKKNPADSTKYQEQIWTLKDFKAGCLVNINEKHLEEIFSVFSSSIKENVNKKTSNLFV